MDLSLIPDHRGAEVEEGELRLNRLRPRRAQNSAPKMWSPNKMGGAGRWRTRAAASAAVLALAAAWIVSVDAQAYGNNNGFL